MINEEQLENIILGCIAKELKDEIEGGRQVRLAETIMRLLRVNNIIGRSEQLVCDECYGWGYTVDEDGRRKGHCTKCD